MARMYALLQDDGRLLVARPAAGGWSVSENLSGLEPRGRNLTVFIDTPTILGFRVSLPMRGEAEARRAAAYAIEDEIAEPVDQLHVALAPPRRDAGPPGERWISIVGADEMDGLLARLDELGIPDAALIAAHSVLPEDDMLYASRDGALVRLADRSFSTDAGLAGDALAAIVSRHGDVAVYGESLAEQLSRPAAGAGAASPHALLEQLADWQEASGRGINLRQGRHVARGEVRLGDARHWRLAASLIAIVSIAWFTVTLLETRAMRERTDSLRRVTSDFVTAGWPEADGDASRVSALAATPGGAPAAALPSALNVSAAIYAALEGVDGGEVRALRYDRGRGQAVATLAVGAFADFDRVAAALNEAGVLARTGDARQNGDKVVGEIIVEPAA